MKRISSLSLILFLALILDAQPQTRRSFRPRARLGINIAGPSDWNTELPFVDVFRMSRDWISQQSGRPWGRGPSLILDEHGWVKSLERDCYVETPLVTIEGGHYPSGKYTVLFDGQGQLRLKGAKLLLSEPGRMAFDVDATKGGLWLRVDRTNPEDYIRNIRVLMPGFESQYESNRTCPFLILENL